MYKEQEAQRLKKQC